MKPVTKYSLDGVPLETFDSVFEAASDIKKRASSISNVLIGRKFSCGGFRYGYKDKPLRDRKEDGRLRPIILTKDNVDYPFNSIAEAIKFCKGDNGAISRALVYGHKVKGFEVRDKANGREKI